MLLFSLELIEHYQKYLQHFVLIKLFGIIIYLSLEQKIISVEDKTKIEINILDSNMK